MRFPRHLWAGDWRSDSDDARDAVEQERAAAAERAAAERRRLPDPPSRPSRWRRHSGKFALLGLTVATVAVVAIVATALIGGSDKPPSLPASSAVVKPQKGQTRAGAVYAAASPAVVSIRRGGSSGTGFLVSNDGRIVTNSHVVDTSDKVIVRFGRDSEPVSADVLGTDPSSDLAVLSIDPQAVPAGVRPLPLADSNTVQVGDPAIAIGNPFGLDRTATEGIVSGIGREIQAPNGFSIEKVIQTDAPINPGNSGGPLLDDSGRVIGVNSQIQTTGTQGNVGIGFAVPSNTVRAVVPVLARGDTIKRAYLGVETSPASTTNPNGAEVQRVVSNGPGDQAGLKTGDVIKRIDGKEVREPADVSIVVSQHDPGDLVGIEVERGGSIVNVNATLGTRPAGTP